MRIISGIHKGRRLQGPKNLTVRPTTDFAKEALFNILNQRYQLHGLSVLDLFAGIGSISFEFASRGAKEISLVEKNANCIKFIQQTIARLKLENIERVVHQDVYQFLSQEKNLDYDLIFADPPYDFTKNQYGNLLDLIFNKTILAETGLLILEHSGKMDFKMHSNFTEHRKYGSVNFSFFKFE